MLTYQICPTCREFKWSNAKKPHVCSPVYEIIDRNDWFNDEREINELTKKEFDEIDWYYKIRANNPTEAAEKYLKYLCNQGDGLVERADIYVRNDIGMIFRQVVVAEITLSVDVQSSDEIKMPDREVA